MKAAIVTAPHTNPIIGELPTPIVKDGEKILTVKTVALSNLTKMRARGEHYSSDTTFPMGAGMDGIGIDENGKRFYFVNPSAPYGSIGEQSVVKEKFMIEIPDDLDDVTAAAIANPGMSSWAALVHRANIQPGDTVLINGATGSGGMLAIKIAKILGAGKVIAMGRNQTKLEVLLSDGADEIIVHNSDNNSEKELAVLAKTGIDIVLDYLWGESALAIMGAIARHGGQHRTQFVNIGSAGGDQEINLPAAALRSSSIELKGSGLTSISFPDLLKVIHDVFEATAKYNLNMATTEFEFNDLEKAWDAPTQPRAVIKL